MDGLIDIRTDGWTDRRTLMQTDGRRTDKTDRTGRWFDRQTDGKTDLKTDGGGQTDGQKAQRQTDRWSKADRWIEGT
jgi:hypothetical protein